MMDHLQQSEDEDAEREGDEDERFFVEDCSSSGGEFEFMFRHQQRHSGRESSRTGSPPLVLAFCVSTGGAQRDGSPGPAPCSDPDSGQEQEQEQEEPIEEWMILGGEEQEGDASIQLNLGYWSSSSNSEDDDCHSGNEGQNLKSVDHPWAVSDKDKGVDQLLPSRYYMPGLSLMCHCCNKTGHLAKSCPIRKKCRTCVLCGIQGHIQRDCPGRHCPTCGLPSHGLRPCREPPIWSQHCQRCGMTGHLSDACPDTWRQYHLTVQSEAPLRPQPDRSVKHTKHRAHCYNCSAQGHYGYECTRRRMVSGMFPSLPYVCHYDTKEDIVQHHTRMQRRTKELASAGSVPLPEHQHLSEPAVESGEENQPAQGKRRSQEARSRDGRRKTWPEKRRERRELKKLRREAQARREGALLGRTTGGSSDDDVCTTDPFRMSSHHYRQSENPPKKRRNEERGGRRSRKSREAERWMKRGGLKHPHIHLGAIDENLLSTKQRVRHRRR
ncbi:zinc finger CCHC domain-containing protein 7-like isoform X2 [Myripristis murdjan]|uniref:Zinc finger CCHC domain-containing protein 7 n=1 Tax=Myripristis murdjan TaxID=586833 RepID=A0A667XD76_9TELE|nr:zinc finger CCHC domain-containing protein 7-like isoform X2 [Myripristis murdjan]